MEHPTHKRINTTITVVQFQALHRLSVLTGIGFAELVRRAIDQYVAAPDVTLPFPETQTQLKENR